MRYSWLLKLIIEKSNPFPISTRAREFELCSFVTFGSCRYSLRENGEVSKLTDIDWRVHET